MKRALLTVLSVFVLWQVMDFVIHGLILGQVYNDTASLWRPMEEMKMGVMRVVSLISAACFVSVFNLFFKEKTVKTGITYGLIFGIGTGVSMGYGTYSVMPIPYVLAIGWTLGSLAECIAAGALTGWLLKAKA